MMIKKPTLTEDQFLRGSKARQNGADAPIRLMLRIPKELHARITERAWQERISLNALVCAVLDSAVGAKDATGSNAAKGAKRA